MSVDYSFYDLIGLFTSYNSIMVLISKFPQGTVMVAQKNSASR